MSRIARPVSLAIALAMAVLPIAAATVAAQAAVTAPAATGDISWSVEPLQTADGTRRSFEYSVDPGTQIVDSVVITNSGDTEAEFLIYASDAMNVLETGAFGLLERDTASTDVGSWITMNSDTITIAPGMQAIVPFDLLVPSDATPGEHVAGVIASVVTAGESDGAAVELEQRVAARVYLTVSGAVQAGVEVEGLSTSFNPEFNPFAPGNVDVNYTVRNSGNVRVDVLQTITVNGPFGIQLAQFTPTAVSELLPRQSVRVQDNVPAVLGLFLSFSTVTVTPSVLGAALAENSGDDAAADSLADSPIAEVVATEDELDYTPVSETSFSVAISWTLLVLFLIVIGLIYLAWRYVSGTRERMYLAIDEATAAAREESAAPTGNSTEKVGV